LPKVKVDARMQVKKIAEDGKRAIRVP